MSLTREQAQEIVNVVAKDANCVNRINSIFGKLPANIKGSGEIRNLLITAAFDVVPDVLERFGVKERMTPQSTEFAQHCCVAISDAVCTLFKHHRNLPFIKEISGGSCVTTDHYAPIFKMKSGGEYVFDWWMSLDVQNPIIWRKFEWEHFTDPTHFFDGVPLKEFKGFDLNGLENMRTRIPKYMY